MSNYGGACLLHAVSDEKNLVSIAKNGILPGKYTGQCEYRKKSIPTLSYLEAKLSLGGIPVVSTWGKHQVVLNDDWVKSNARGLYIHPGYTPADHAEAYFEKVGITQTLPAWKKEDGAFNQVVTPNHIPPEAFDMIVLGELSPFYASRGPQGHQRLREELSPYLAEDKVRIRDGMQTRLLA